MMRTVCLGLMCIATLVGGCAPDATVSIDDPSRDDATVWTDSVRYTLRVMPGVYDASAIVTFANRGTSPIAFARCSMQSTTPMWDIRRTGRDSTANAYIGGGWACVGGVPTGQLAPGDSMLLRVWIGSATSPNANPPIQPAERVGRFRLALRLCKVPVADSDRCDLLPQAQRQSNAFEVVFP